MREESVALRERYRANLAIDELGHSSTHPATQVASVGMSWFSA